MINLTPMSSVTYHYSTCLGDLSLFHMSRWLIIIPHVSVLDLSLFHMSRWFIIIPHVSVTYHYSTCLGVRPRHVSVIIIIPHVSVIYHYSTCGDLSLFSRLGDLSLLSKLTYMSHVVDLSLFHMSRWLIIIPHVSVTYHYSTCLGD